MTPPQPEEDVSVAPDTDKMWCCALLPSRSIHVRSYLRPSVEVDSEIFIRGYPDRSRDSTPSCTLEVSNFLAHLKCIQTRGWYCYRHTGALPGQLSLTLRM